ncbi:TSN6 protein, partial [Hippolais icterina]|nr:TSN6 protein [Hippolais icterina]
YAMLLSLIFLIVLVAAIVVFVFRHEIKTNFESNLNLALKYYNVTVDRHSKAVDTIQRTVRAPGWERPHCCQHRSIFPWSCRCFGEELVCTPGGRKHWIHLLTLPPLQGCFFLVTSTMESKMSVVAGISFGIACFQV